MTEIIHVFQTPVSYGERGWTAEARGQGREDGRWEGWLVFTPADGPPPRATEPETTQSTRQALVYGARSLAPAQPLVAFPRPLRRTAEPGRLPVINAFARARVRRPGLD